LRQNFNRFLVLGKPISINFYQLYTNQRKNSAEIIF